jgi:hypothetical protein
MTTSSVWCIYGVPECGIFDGVQHTYVHKKDIYTKFYTGLYIGMLLYILYRLWDCLSTRKTDGSLVYYDYNRVWF